MRYNCLIHTFLKIIYHKIFNIFRGNDLIF